MTRPLVERHRDTKETTIDVSLLLDGSGQVSVETGLPFFDHMLATFARYAGLSLSVLARGDLAHHLMEDVAITVGLAFRKAIPPTAARFGERTVPMDDALVQAVVDVGGRSYYRGRLPNALYEHWMRSFAENAGATLHLRVLRGRNRHHVVECAFKALGLALRDALAEGGAVFSLKGAVKVTEGGS